MQTLSDRPSRPTKPDTYASDKNRHPQQDQLRDTLLAELDAQRADLRAALAQRSSPSDSGEADRIGHQLAELSGLRHQVAFAGSLRHLVQLQHRVTDMGSQGAVVVGQAGDRSPSGPAALSVADHQRRSAELAREADHSLAQNDRLFRDAVGVAERHGVDLSAFEQERARLRKEREEAERRGDHLNARKADALIAGTTTNALTETLPHITDPAERARQLVRIDQARQQEEAARKRLERQAELDGRMQATAAGMAPAEAKAHVESVKHDTMQEFEAEKAKLPGAVSGSRTALGHVDVGDPRKPAAAAVADKLTPDETARVRQAAAAIAGSNPSDSRESEPKAPASTPKAEGRSAEARTV